MATHPREEDPALAHRQNESNGDGDKDSGKRASCLGKSAAVFDSRTLHFGAYLTGGLPAPPPSFDYSKKVRKWPMYLNNHTNDCACAAAAHMIQSWTANAGHEITPTDQQVLEFYGSVKAPGPEGECGVLKVLKDWRSSGLGGHRITAFAQIEHKNATEVRDAIYLFGACYLALWLPSFAVPGSDVAGWLKTPWVVPPQGPVGDAAPNPQISHCIPVVGYDYRNLYLVTWGAIKTMSWQFYREYTKVAYAVVSGDFLKEGKTVAGFDLAQLERDLREVSQIPAAHATIFRDPK